MDWIKSKGRDLTIYIVGAHTGHEVDALLGTGAVRKIILFEALPSTAKKLRDRMVPFGDKTEIVEKAVCDFDGNTKFFETNLPGAGSVLEPSAIVHESYGGAVAYEVEVETTRLDTFAATHGSKADVLWIDVQGAEMKVLQGADDNLATAKIVFIEVSSFEPLYNGGCVIAEITDFLAGYGFCPTQLGTDPLNGTGNALYLKRSGLGLASLAA